MRVSYDWLRSYTGDLPPPAELAERLTMTGSNVEALEEIPGGDTCFEIEVTTNRSDCLCHLGLAREAAALTPTAFLAPDITFEEGSTPVERLAAVRVADAALCPRYTARVIEGVRVGPSPTWLVRRLEAVGLRPVNNVVDVTNFVLFECGQPLHAFDLDRLEGGRIVVRRARAGETITAIDGSVHKLTGEMLVIADARRPVAVAGIMGGRDTEVGQATTRVLLESAEFDRLNTRRTSRALGLASDSSYRFERGIDPLGVGWASRRAVQLIHQVAGGRIAQGVIDVNFQEHEEPRVALRLPRIASLLGVEIPRAKVLDLLERLQFGVESLSGDSVTVHVPSFRPDVTREVDLIEEVARMYGYDRIPHRPAMRITMTPPGARERVVRAVAECLVGAGCFEAVTFSFLSDHETRLFTAWSDRPPIQVDDARRGHDNRLRTTLLPSLLGARRVNQDRAHVDADLFEIAGVYLPRPGQGLPDEPLHAGMVVSGDFGRVKGLVEAVLRALGCQGKVRWEPYAAPFFAAGAGARVALGGAAAGYAGLVAEPALRILGLKRPAAAAELDLDCLIPHAELRPRYRPLPVFPAVRRDLNIVVEATAPWATIEQIARDAGGDLLEAVTFRETYRGEQVPAARKSVVFTLVFRAPDRTLTHEEADAAQAAVLTALRESLGAELRA